VRIHCAVQVATLTLVACAAAVAQTATEHASAPRESTAVFAGGCYWTVEAVFEHVSGVRNVVSGFAVPAAPIAPAPALRHTSYAEAVRVTYDPSRISYAQLLQVFFLVAHDPTQVDRQGADVGPQYRSVVFVSGDDQREAAQRYMSELTSHGIFPRPIATEIASARSFNLADDQDFIRRNPHSLYATEHVPPLLAALQQRFPTLYHP
jgi:peptide-methionine (S)-S-oxide reductase